jgi:hypothetical protein
MPILLIGDRNNFIRWILSGGSESRANSGGSAQDNAVSKGIRGSSSSWGLWVGCEGRIGMDVSVIRMVIILLFVEDQMKRMQSNLNTVYNSFLEFSSCKKWKIVLYYSRHDRNPRFRWRCMLLTEQKHLDEGLDCRRKT